MGDGSPDTALDSRVNVASGRTHLARAWVLAENGRGTTSPNPFVGCVIERNGVIVGEGWTQPAGDDHAEIVALREAGGDAAGATAWVTLEPCNHQGRTGPCSVALADAGIGRVVVAMSEPQQLAEGGTGHLREHGVQVEHAGWDDWIREQNRTWVTTVEQRRPWVTLKIAATADGRMTSEERWITGPLARTEVHRLRARADAVLVGSGTVVADDPRLDVRHVPASQGQPRPVVIDRRGRTPSTAALLGPGTVIVTASRDPAWRSSMEHRGALLLDGVDPLSWLSPLLAHGVASILAEPGPTLAQAMVEAEVVDEVVLHQQTGRSPRLPAPLRGRTWRHVRTRMLGDDVETILEPLES